MVISNATAHVAPDILIDQSIMSDRTARPKTLLEIRKKATFLYVINNSIVYKFIKDFTNHRKKANRWSVAFSCNLSQKPLTTGTTDKTF